MKVCPVCQATPPDGRRVCPGPCAERWAAYTAPAPRHERIERDHARGRYAQSDAVRGPDDGSQRSRPSK